MVVASTNRTADLAGGNTGAQFGFRADLSILADCDREKSSDLGLI
jgi:hypothetical protein